MKSVRYFAFALKAGRYDIYIGYNPRPTRVLNCGLLVLEVYDSNRLRCDIAVTSASTIDLPLLPSRWQGSFHGYRGPRWSGWIANDYWSDDIAGQLQNPETLFSGQSLVSWYKQGRNRLAVVLWPQQSQGAGRQVVLKAYGTAGWHGWLRGRIRPGRAMQHWQRAADLQDRGVRTPQPVWLAIPQDRQQGSVYLAVEPAPPHLRLRELLQNIGPTTTAIDFAGHQLAVTDLVEALGHYARDLHQAGIAHRDFSGGNILVPVSWNGRAEGLLGQFVLLDINRARLFDPGTVDIYHRIQDLERITLVESQQQAFYMAYAGDDVQLQAQWPRYRRYRRADLRMRRARNPLWRVLLESLTYWVRTG